MASKNISDTKITNERNHVRVLPFPHSKWRYKAHETRKCLCLPSHKIISVTENCNLRI